MTKNFFKFFLKVLACAMLVISCSPKKSYNIKKVFFDGVPNPFLEDISEIYVIDSTNLDLLDSINAIKEPTIIYHQPYQEKKCKTCHQKYTRSQAMATSKDLCYTCHDNLETAYQNVHAPVETGYCTQCHDPHKSKNRALLLKSDNELCYNCHNQDDIEATNIHKTIGEKKCTTCHNAHGGDTNFYLNKNTCFECHDNYNDSYANLHGPVAAGLCSSCHDNHKSKQPHLLKTSGNRLCLNCHNNKNLNTTSAHNDINTQTCTACHNPHGGANKYLLTKNTSQ